MASRIHNITVDCQHPFELAQFWSAVLDRPVHPDNEPQDDEVGIPLDSGGELLFVRVPEDKHVKNRLHLCLVPEHRQHVEVERLVSLGASVHDDRRRRDGQGWAVLRDPAGNEFCVLRGQLDRGETT